jgi:hypothetical protein
MLTWIVLSAHAPVNFSDFSVGVQSANACRQRVANCVHAGARVNFALGELCGDETRGQLFSRAEDL